VLRQRDRRAFGRGGRTHSECGRDTGHERRVGGAGRNRLASPIEQLAAQTRPGARQALAYGWLAQTEERGNLGN
jgi:hypothetical protein